MKRASVISSILVGSVLFAGTAHAADLFGAIAYSPSTGAWGGAWNYSSAYDAEAVAERECRDHGGNANDALWRVWFMNGCGALATGTGGIFAADWDGDARGAQLKALQECSAAGSGCKILVTLCTGNVGAVTGEPAQPMATGGVVPPSTGATGAPPPRPLGGVRSGAN
jgi:serine/threonine-protein kinase